MLGLEGAQSICDYNGEMTPEFIKAVEYLYERGLIPMDPRFMYSPRCAPVE